MAYEVDPELASAGQAATYASLPKEQRIAQTEQLRRERQSDVERWNNPLNFKKEWTERARIVAGLIDPGSRVLDLGCGQMELEVHMPPGCDYIPADIGMRDDRTLLCDLNRGQLPQVRADVATMLGVIEYIHAPGDLFRLLATRWPRLVMTYNPADLDGPRDRRIHGWLCDLTSAEMVQAACTAGFDLAAQLPVDARQVVYDLRSKAG